MEPGRLSPEHLGLATTVAIGAKLGSLQCCVAYPVSLAGTTSEQGTLSSRASLGRCGRGRNGTQLAERQNVSMTTKPAPPPPKRGSLASVFQATGGQPKPTSWRKWGTDQRLSLPGITSSPGPWAAAEPEQAGKVGQSPEVPSPPSPRARAGPLKTGTLRTSQALVEAALSYDREGKGS